MHAFHKKRMFCVAVIPEYPPPLRADGPLLGKDYYNSTQRVESLEAYAYSRRISPWEFFIVFKLGRNKKFQQTNPTGYTCMLQMIPPEVYH